MPVAGQSALVSPAPEKKLYAKDNIATATTKAKLWFHDEKDAAETFDEWAVEEWLNSPVRKGKYMVAPHKDPDLNVHNFDESYPVNTKVYWENSKA